MIVAPFQPDAGQSGRKVGAAITQVTVHRWRAPPPDPLLKRDRLQQAGCASYWLVDPEEPALLALELRDGVYVEVANVSGDEVWAATLPFPMTVVPNLLLD